MSCASWSKIAIGIQSEVASGTLALGANAVVRFGPIARRGGGSNIQAPQCFDFHGSLPPCRGTLFTYLRKQIPIIFPNSSSTSENVSRGRRVFSSQQRLLTMAKARASYSSAECPPCIRRHLYSLIHPIRGQESCASHVWSGCRIARERSTWQRPL